MAEVTLNGVAIHHELLGEGKPVAFLNGVMMTTQSWVLQTSVLRRRYRCVLHDFRCQLRSGKPAAPFTMATHAEDLRALLDHLEIERAHVVGTSYGGEVGMIFAYTFPRRVESLTIISSASRVGPGLRRVVESWALAARREPSALYRLSVPHNFSSRFISESPELIEQGEERLRRCSPEFFPAFARLCDAFLELDIEGRLGEIDSPTLVLCGEQDRLKPPRYSRQIAASIADSELLVVPGAGHAVIIERPDVVNSAVLAFLERVEANPR